jgi:hypothetical protein
VGQQGIYVGFMVKMGHGGGGAGPNILKILLSTVRYPTYTRTLSLLSDVCCVNVA